GTVIIGDANDFELIRPDGVVMWCPPRGVASNAPPGAPPRFVTPSRQQPLDFVPTRPDAALDDGRVRDHDRDHLSDAPPHGAVPVLTLFAETSALS
ncbi:MAG: hypothetical protein ACO3C1_10965, partial [Ilumatobacteraceae bacterium]